MFEYVIIIVSLFVAFLQALVHWSGPTVHSYESCYVVSVVNLACVSDWTVTDYLFAAGRRLFKHLLLSTSVYFTILFHCSSN